MQNIYDVRQKGKLIFLLISVLLVGGVLYVSNDLVDDLSVEERKKMEIWAEATRSAASNVTNVDMNLILKILQSNTTIPIIIADDQGQVLQTHNLEIPNRHGEQFLQKK